jgi:hypothetical protein
MSATTLLEVVTIAPVAKHTATVIFIHGLGDSDHGWKPVGDVPVSPGSVFDLEIERGRVDVPSGSRTRASQVDFPACAVDPYHIQIRAEHAGMVRLNLHSVLV